MSNINDNQADDNMSLNIIPLRDMWKWQYVEQVIHKVMSFFGYKEIRPPLFLSKEVIDKVYDKDHNISMQSSFYQIDSTENIFLRPDGTVTCLYNLLKNEEISDHTFVYYLGQMFRRSRRDNLENTGQFHQFGAEAIGSDSYVIDIETIRLGLNIFKNFGLSNLRLEINSYGCPDCRPVYLKKLHSYWVENHDNLCEDCCSSYSYFVNHSDKCSQCNTLWLKSPAIPNVLCPTCTQNFNHIKKTLANLMINFVVNPHLNMNFPYYNRLVFQYKILNKDEYKIIGSGGRYNNLVRMVTGNMYPAVGFSANIETLLAILEDKNLLPYPDKPFQVYVHTVNPDLETSLLQIVQELRDNEIIVIIGNSEQRSKVHLKTAQKEGCSLMITISNEAIREGKVQIENLAKKHKETINLRDILATITRLKKSLTNNTH